MVMWGACFARFDDGLHRTTANPQSPDCGKVKSFTNPPWPMRPLATPIAKAMGAWGDQVLGTVYFFPPAPAFQLPEPLCGKIVGCPRGLHYA
jgi:hypothetical protein